jgi:ATP-dependent RNA helicase RhlE
MTYFSDLGLAEPILRALDTKGYADPTPIQRQAIPALLEGRDLLGIAQTGTGKTAAFSLPSLHRLAAEAVGRKPASCRMLVLSPTRELAAQIAENMRGYARYLNLSVQCVFGGIPVGRQARALTAGVDILVATPGRLLDLIEQRALTLRNVEIFVLDEADQMMDLGFIVPLKRIAAMLPEKRQSLFFSATMPQAIAELGKQFIRNPVKVEVAPQSTTAERVEQYATFLNQSEKQALLTIKLRDGLADTESDQAIDRALVFTRTKHGSDRVVRHLATAGIKAAAIHGNKSQAQRTAALQGFRNGTIRVLVATDIAARGIDVSGVSHVFNFEIPNVPEQYVHRIGRTARAGADGIAISFVAPDEKAYIRDIERLTGVKLAQLPLPEDFQKEAARLPLPAKKTLEQDNEGRRDHGGRGQRDGHRGQQPRRGRPEGRGDGRRDDARRPQRDPREGGEARREEGGVEIDRRARPGQHRDAVRHADPRRERARDDRAPRTEQAARPAGGERRFGEMPRSARPVGERPQGDRPRSDRPHGDRPRSDRPQGARPQGNNPQRRRQPDGRGRG